MQAVDIKNYHEDKINHCEKCAAIIAQICSDELPELSNLDLPCMYKADDLNRYLLRCIIESYKDKVNGYIKPTLVAEGKWDHYHNEYNGNYNLDNFITSGDSDIFLVFGEAGIGKSTFMNELYLSVLLSSLKGRCDILPIMLKAENYGGEGKSPQEWLHGCLKDKYRYLDFSPAFFSPAIQVVIFLDAINDIQYSDYTDFRNKLNQWRDFIENSFSCYSNIKFVLSSRHLDSLSSFEIRNYTRLFIKPFNNDQINEFIVSTTDDAFKKDQILSMILENNDLPFLRIPFFLRKIIMSQNTSIKNRTDIINTFIESIFIKGNAFLRSRRTMIVRHDQEYSDVKLNGTTIIDALCELAFNNQRNNKMDIQRSDIEKLLHHETDQFIDLVINNSIFMREGTKFIHPILQEYFAGRYIYSHLPLEYKIEDVLLISEEVRRIHTLKHVYNFTPNKEKLINLLMDNELYALAAECVLEDTNKSLMSLVAGRIVNHLDKTDIVYSNQSYNIGILLGRLGDFRITGNLNESEIQFRGAPVNSLNNIKVGIFPVTNYEYNKFIIDGGYYNLEFWKDSASLAWQDFDKRINSICEFWYNIQDKLNSNSNGFIRFCLDNELDKELIAHLAYFKRISRNELKSMMEELYSEEKNRKPLMWDVPTYNNPSQPVIGVSIYEAFAFCQWLSKKTAKHYRLLTKDEWEVVSDSSRKIYAYGNRPNTQYANTIESGFKKVFPVGVCKKNCSKDGIFDLTGNIFEWTSSVYDSTQSGMFVQYICKGGSWIQDLPRSKSSYIGRGMGWVRNLDLGFRVCLDEN